MTPHRTLQSAKYRANYQARFQWLLEGTCGGPNPLINVLCKGTFELLDVSDSSIVCEPLDEPVAGFNGYQCRMTCTDREDCSDVWLSTNVETGPYGEIFFQCEGDEPADVDGAVQYLGSEGNTCSYNVWGDGRSFHVAQLGVFCPEEAEYNFQDYYVECGFNNLNKKIGGRYTCMMGDNCGGFSCTRDIRTVTINVDHFRLGTCIQSLDGSELPDPVQPELIERQPGTYSARFQANWQLDLDVSCTGEFPIIVMECANGDISNVNTIPSCEITSPSSMNCTESDEATFVDEFSGVEFVSVCAHYLYLFCGHVV